MADVWLERVKDNLRQSETGSRLLQECELNGWNIQSADSRTDSRFQESEDGSVSAGYASSGTKTIVVNRDLGHDVAVTSLAHEAEHARQHSQGEAPSFSDSKSGYVQQALRNEAKAESAANQVAYELSELGYGTPLESQLDGSYHDQTEAYVNARGSNATHPEAAAASEALWSLNPNALYYQDQAAAEWEAGDAYFKSAFPEQKDEVAVEDSHWLNELHDLAEKSRLNPAPNDPGMTGQTRVAAQQSQPSTPAADPDPWVAEQQAVRDTAKLKAAPPPTPEPPAQSKGMSL